MHYHLINAWDFKILQRLTLTLHGRQPELTLLEPVGRLGLIGSLKRKGRTIRKAMEGWERRAKYKKVHAREN